MSVNASPANASSVPARTDTARTDTARTDTATGPGAPVTDPTRPVRLGGLAMAAGAASWALGTVLTYDVDPVDGEYPLGYKASSLLFQLGLVALVAVQRRTGATGTGTFARRFLHAEHAMLGLAIASSLQWMVAPDLSESPFFLALDLFWPLSMLGMAAIGIRIAIAGRWRGPTRIWPAVAETWVLVMLPVSALASAEVGSFVGAAHLLVGYTMLGVLLAARPELTGVRD